MPKPIKKRRNQHSVGWRKGGVHGQIVCRRCSPDNPGKNWRGVSRFVGDHHRQCDRCWCIHGDGRWNIPCAWKLDVGVLCPKCVYDRQKRHGSLSLKDDCWLPTMNLKDRAQCRDCGYNYKQGMAYIQRFWKKPGVMDAMKEAVCRKLTTTDF